MQSGVRLKLVWSADHQTSDTLGTQLEGFYFILVGAYSIAQITQNLGSLNITDLLAGVMFGKTICKIGSRSKHRKIKLYHSRRQIIQLDMMEMLTLNLGISLGQT